MSLLDKIQSLGKAIKESGETSLFSVLSNKSLTEAFKANPGHFFLFPFIALGITVSWIIETINYARSRNKSWFNTTTYIAATVISGLAVSSILGTVILGEFMLGPFLFVGALSTGIALQTGLFFKNLYHALRSPKGSSQRMGYFQEMAKNAFNAILIGFTLGLVVAAMISPAGPVILAALGITAAVLTVASLTWQFMPKHWKHAIKSAFGFGKQSYEGRSELEELQELNARQAPEAQGDGLDEPLLPQNSNVRDFNLFKQEQRKFEIVKVAEQSPSRAREMLITSLKSHIQRLAKHSLHHSDIGERIPQESLYHEGDQYYTSSSAYQSGQKPLGEQLNKQGQKIEVLRHLKDALENMFRRSSQLNVRNDQVILHSIESLHTQYPKAFQSFFNSTSNTESLHESVKFFIENYRDNLKGELEANYQRSTLALQQ